MPRAVRGRDDAPRTGQTVDKYFKHERSPAASLRGRRLSFSVGLGRALQLAREVGYRRVGWGIGQIALRVSSCSFGQRSRSLAFRQHVHEVNDLFYTLPRTTTFSQVNETQVQQSLSNRREPVLFSSSMDFLAAFCMTLNLPIATVLVTTAQPAPISNRTSTVRKVASQCALTNGSEVGNPPTMVAEARIRRFDWLRHHECRTIRNSRSSFCHISAHSHLHVRHQSRLPTR